MAAVQVLALNVMQQQLDWLLARLMPAQVASLGNSPGALHNGNMYVVSPYSTHHNDVQQQLSAQKASDSETLNEAWQPPESAGIRQRLDDALQQVAELRSQLQDVESKLGASQQEVDCLTKRLNSIAGSPSLTKHRHCGSMSSGR